ncbi:cellulose binding domain-containing protein, partial [Streptomyces sp. PAL114]|uniref:cellulose binding domain-containing protein n=1 Tax=Streptomyces sp. PAL114 TaxID=2970893 RepID=UPI0028FCFB5C
MSTHRRRISGRNKAIGAVAAAAVAGGGAFLFTGTAQAAGVAAAYTRTSEWPTGYTAQYVVTNNSGGSGDWTLEFELPAGTELGSLWNAESRVSGRHVTVTPPKWDTDGLAAGESVTVGFVVKGTADPTGCLVDGSACVSYTNL